MICTIWNRIFGIIYEKLKKLNFWAIFSIFEAEAQLGALKILKSRKTKVFPNYSPHLLRLQAYSFLEHIFKKMGSTEIVMSSVCPSVCLSVTYFSASIAPRELKF
jgi:hypothetical protein